MITLIRKLEDIIDFFARDILSLSILFCLLAFLANTIASAQPSVSKKMTPVNSSQIKQKKYIDEYSTGSLNKQIKFHDGQPQKNWQISLDVSAGQKAISNGSDLDKNAYIYSLNTETSYKFNESISLKGILNYDSYSKNELQNDISDLLMSLYFYKGKVGTNLTFKPYLTTTVPLSKDSKQRQQMNFGVGLGGGLSGQSKLVAGSLSYAFGLSAHKYFHRYETALNNSINTSYSSNQHVSLGWGLGAFSTSGLFRHLNSWNYSGTMTESFIHLESVSYSATDALSFSLGHTNSGSVLSPNQEEIEIRLIDENNSMVFVSTTYVF